MPVESERSRGSRRPESQAGRALRSEQRSSARAGRKPPQPPSWPRVLKRGMIFAPIFLATVILIGGNKSYRERCRVGIAAARRLRSVQLLHGHGRLAPVPETPRKPGRTHAAFYTEPARRRPARAGPDRDQHLRRPDTCRGAGAIVVDPSGDAGDDRLHLASIGASCAAILVTHGHFDHIVSLAALAEETGAPVYAPAGETILLEEPDAFAPPGIPFGRARPTCCSRAGRRSRLRASRSRSPECPGTRPRTSRITRTAAVLRRRPVRRLGRAHRPSRRRLGPPRAVDR